MYSVIGTVYDSDSEEPLALVTVYLMQNSESEPADSSYTNENGRFIFDEVTYNLSDGWWISYYKPGYLKVYKEIEYVLDWEVADTHINKSLQFEAAYQSGSENPSGIWGDGQNIWTIDKVSGELIKYDGQMNVLERQQTGIQQPGGLAWYNGRFYTCSCEDRNFYTINTESNATAFFDSIKFPLDQNNLPEVPADLSWRDENLLGCYFYNNYIQNRCLKDENEYNMFTQVSAVDDPVGIAAYENNYFISDNSGLTLYDKKNNKIYKFTQDTEEEGEISYLTWDGYFLWGIDIHKNLIVKYSMTEYN